MDVDDDDDDDDDDNDMTWRSFLSLDNDEMVQYWKNGLVDTYTNKLYLSLFASRWTHIHCLVLRSKTNNFQLIKPLLDSDLEIRIRGAGHPDTEIRGGGSVLPKKKIFFWPFGPQFGLKIRAVASPSPSTGSTTVNWLNVPNTQFALIKKGKMTHWTRYCATASFVYHSGKPILTLNLSPSRQSELLVGSTVKSLYKHTSKTDSSLNALLASVPNIFYFTWLSNGDDGVYFKQRRL